jgi:hypothetical protein
MDSKVKTEVEYASKSLKKRFKMNLMKENKN